MYLGWMSLMSPVFGKQSFDFAVGLDEIEIDDGFAQPGFFMFEFGCGLEIAGDAIAQAGGLADVDDMTGGVFHEIDAGRFRQGFGFFGEFFEALVHESDGRIVC